MEVEGSQEVELAYATNTSELVSDAIALGENCQTYDDGVDTFLVGQCSQNYVWYSGKLWRVVLKNNETGAVKMVTDNPITAIPCNVNSNVAFKDNYVDQWLNQEFLQTLHEHENYLEINSIWDTTENSSDTPARPSYTTFVERTVGLLNAYEYYTTYNNSDGLTTATTGYLNNEVSWWLMTPFSSTNVRFVAGNGSLSKFLPMQGYAVRPSVYLKPSIKVSGGTGIKSDPYILDGDIKEPVNGTTLLSSRYSGEYLIFNNELYRIVDIEDGTTKITAVDNSNSLMSIKFDSSTNPYVNDFANANIKTDLENYYQQLKTTNESAYDMIEPNTTWYLGPVDSTTNYHYKGTVCASIDSNVSMNACTEKAVSTAASIGLPRVGEMFTSQITRGEKVYFWTLTPYSSSNVRRVNADSQIVSDIPTYDRGVRPSMYLKSNVVIASDNTGNGTYEYPYSIELGQ